MFAFVFFLSPFIALAGTEHNMSGWAWNANDNGSGIGWISFNSTNCDTDANGHVDSGYCGGNNSTGSVIDYGVNQDVYDNLVGYAWSSSIGLIQFGGLSGFPKQQGSASRNDHNALVVSGKLSGWAKAIGADLDKSDDWDGWISLSGITADNHNYGVMIDQKTGKFSGYAWGSDVIGIVNFDRVVVLATPTGLSPKAGDCVTTGGKGTINVKWSQSIGAIGYTLKVDSIFFDRGLLTSYTHGDLDAGSSHSYSVQATYSSGSSLYSPSSYQNAPDACSVPGVCSTPPNLPNHLSPCPAGTPSAIEPSSSKWTWTCTGSDNNPVSCSENRTPGWVEP